MQAANCLFIVVHTSTPTAKKRRYAACEESNPVPLLGKSNTLPLSYRSSELHEKECGRSCCFFRGASAGVCSTNTDCVPKHCESSLSNQRWDRRVQLEDSFLFLYSRQCERRPRALDHAICWSESSSSCAGERGRAATMHCRVRVWL